MFNQNEFLLKVQTRIVKCIKLGWKTWRWFFKNHLHITFVSFVLPDYLHWTHGFSFFLTLVLCKPYQKLPLQMKEFKFGKMLFFSQLRQS